MGRFFRQYDKDYMRMAILKQEETFREQVNELHRLYRVQRLLMQDVTRVAELQARRQNSRDQRRRPATVLLDLEIPAGDGCDNEEDAAQVELTLATGGSGSTRAGVRKKAESSDSGSGASFSSSSSTEGSGSGCGGDSLGVRDWGLWCRSPVEEGQGAVAVAVRQGRAEQRPSWHMQYLSLNMT